MYPSPPARRRGHSFSQGKNHHGASLPSLRGRISGDNSKASERIRGLLGLALPAVSTLSLSHVGSGVRRLGESSVWERLSVYDGGRQPGWNAEAKLHAGGHSVTAAGHGSDGKDVLPEHSGNPGDRGLIEEGTLTNLWYRAYMSRWLEIAVGVGGIIYARTIA